MAEIKVWMLKIPRLDLKDEILILKEPTKQTRESFLMRNTFNRTFFFGGFVEDWILYTQKTKKVLRRGDTTSNHPSFEQEVIVDFVRKPCNYPSLFHVRKKWDVIYLRCDNSTLVFKHTLIIQRTEAHPFYG